MIVSEIEAMARTVDQLIGDGFHGSASRLLSDTVRHLVRAPFQLSDSTKFLVHYTSIDVLFSIFSCPVEHNSNFALSSSGPSVELGKDSGFLRMYDTFNSNDPNEGRFFVDSGPHRFQSDHPELWALLEDRAKLPAYVASFRGVSKLEDVDDLIFWRTYGREGQGCAIVSPVSFFDAIDAPPLQVRYGKDPVQSTLDRLSDVFDTLAAVQSLHHHHLLDTSDPVPDYVSYSLSPIPYLHKSDDYRFESEVRIVVPFVNLARGSLFCHRIHDSTSGLKLRHFANVSTLHVRNILRTDSIVILGPAVPSKPNLSFVLKQRLVNMGLVGAKICSSRIDYRS